MKEAVIITGGELTPGFAGRFLKAVPERILICADAGLRITDALGILPDCIVGDFDTVEQELIDGYRKKQIRILQHQPEKDDTDTELALSYALSLEGISRITILGALGRRFDHALANLEILSLGLKAGIPVSIVDPYNRISLLQGKRSFRRETQYGKYVSFLPFGNEAKGVTLCGFKYPLEHAVLKKGCSLGVSNELAEEEAIAEVTEGILICIESGDKEK